MTCMTSFEVWKNLQNEFPNVWMLTRNMKEKEHRVRSVLGVKICKLPVVLLIWMKLGYISTGIHFYRVIMTDFQDNSWIMIEDYSMLPLYEGKKYREGSENYPRVFCLSGTIRLQIICIWPGKPLLRIVRITRRCLIITRSVPDRLP